MLEIQPLKKVYVCVNKYGTPVIDTVSYYKADSIKQFMKDVPDTTWKQLHKKYGWRCIKVNVIFEVLDAIPK